MKADTNPEPTSGASQAGQSPAFPLAAGSDFRSPLAKARDKFMESAECKRLCEPSLLRGPHESQYLRNRIERAWLLGVEYGEKHPCPNTQAQPCGQNLPPT